MNKIPFSNIAIFSTISLAIPTWGWADSPVGYIDYGRATEIPTLSDAGMIGLVLLLAFFAYQALRRKAAGYPFAILIATGMAVVGSIAGLKLMNPVHAGQVDPLALIDGGSTVEAYDIGINYPVINTASYPQQILDIRGTGCPGTQPETPDSPLRPCQVGDEVPPGGATFCHVKFTSCPPPV